MGDTSILTVRRQLGCQGWSQWVGNVIARFWWNLGVQCDAGYVVGVLMASESDARTTGLHVFLWAHGILE